MILLSLHLTQHFLEQTVHLAGILDKFSFVEEAFFGKLSDFIDAFCIEGDGVGLPVVFDLKFVRKRFGLLPRLASVNAGALFAVGVEDEIVAVILLGHGFQGTVARSGRCKLAAPPHYYSCARPSIEGDDWA